MLRDTVVKIINNHITQITDNNKPRLIARIRAYRRIAKIVEESFTQREHITEKKIQKLDISNYMKLKLGDIIKSKSLPDGNLLINLMSIHGLGKTKAQELIRLGLTNVKELNDERYNKLLPLETRMWLKYKPIERIPRELIVIIDRKLKKLAKKLGLKYTLAGSYRRGKKTSGDIDMIVVSEQSMEDILNSLKPLKIIIYSKGDDKASVLMPTKCDGVQNYVKMDIMKTDIMSYPYFLLYLTGSKDHNIIMRKSAKRQGMLLNQNGLYMLPSLDPIPANSEKDIFESLGLTYKEPHER